MSATGVAAWLGLYLSWSWHVQSLELLIFDAMNHYRLRAAIGLQRIPSLLLSIGIVGSMVAVTLPILAQGFTPPDNGLPGRREGGGTRGGCAAQKPTLTALIPETNWGLTLQAYPTFFWYVPPNTATVAEFVLLDQANAEVYTAMMPLTNQAGVVKLSLPTDGSVPPLEADKLYHWYFSLICDPLDRSADQFTDGWVQRTLPSAELTQKLEAAPDQAKFAIYSEAGIWYDTIATLATLRQQQPENAELAQQWQVLLESVGLVTIADQPLATALARP